MTRFTGFGGVVIGIPTELMPNGTFKCQRITFEGARHYDLSNMRDAVEFFIVSQHPDVKGSPLNTGIPPLWQIDDQNEKAVSYIEKTRKANKLEAVVLELPDARVKDLARALLSSQNQKNSDIFSLDNVNITRRRIIEEIRSNPKAFYVLMSDQGRLEASVIFFRGLEANIISESMESGIMYNGKLLGYNRAMAIDAITKDPKLMMKLDHESKSIERTMNGIATVDEAKSEEDAQLDEALNKLGTFAKEPAYPNPGDVMLTPVVEAPVTHDDLNFMDTGKDDLGKDDLTLKTLVPEAKPSKASKKETDKQ